MSDPTKQWAVIWDSSIKGKNSAAVCMIFEEERAAAARLKTQSDFEPNANVRMFPIFIPWPHPILGGESPEELEVLFGPDTMVKSSVRNMKRQIDILSEKLRELGVDPDDLLQDASY